MAFTPDWQYNVGGYINADQKLKNQKAISYYLFNTYGYTAVSAVLAVMAWIDYLSLDNPGYIDNGSYSNRSGRGFLLWPRTWVDGYAADTGTNWYDGRMQMALMDYYARTTWSSQLVPFTRFKTQVYSGVVRDDLFTKVRQLYANHLRQFIINIPEASYGGDPSDAIAYAITDIGMRLLPYVNEWIRTEWEDTPPTWLYFEMSKRKKGGGKLYL